jgi:putative transposase
MNWPLLNQILYVRKSVDSGSAAKGGARTSKEKTAVGCVNMSSVSFARGNHIVGLNEFHFEWCPKYRYKCMGKEYINKVIEGILRQVAAEYKITIKAIAVGIDHVHVHVALPFDMSPSRALMLLKGKSAYMIFRSFPNFRLRYPKGSFWSPGKFVRSMSDVPAHLVDAYIERQQFDRLYGNSSYSADEERQSNLTDFM